MLKRALLGLVAGGFAGVGLWLTWQAFKPAKCLSFDGLDCPFNMISTPLPLVLAGVLPTVEVALPAVAYAVAGAFARPVRPDERSRT